MFYCFFFSKRILRYSQYNGIYFVWNETQGEGEGRGENTAINKQTNQQIKIKETGSKAVLIDLTIRMTISGRVAKDASEVDRTTPPPHPANQQSHAI